METGILFFHWEEEIWVTGVGDHKQIRNSKWDWDVCKNRSANCKLRFELCREMFTPLGPWILNVKMLVVNTRDSCLAIPYFMSK